jgi:hypothetical protein
METKFQEDSVAIREPSVMRLEERHGVRERGRGMMMSDRETKFEARVVEYSKSLRYKTAMKGVNSMYSNNDTSSSDCISSEEHVREKYG